MADKMIIMLGDELSHYHFGEQHPFGPKRYWAFKQEFESRFIRDGKLSEKIILSTPQQATESQLKLFHTQDYINKVKKLSQLGEGYLDCGDTPARKGIYDSARFVVGTTLKAIDQLMQKKARMPSPQ